MKDFLDTIEKINDSKQKDAVSTEATGETKKTPKKKKKNDDYIELKKAVNPITVSVSEAAKLGGVTTKTIRRAIQSKKLIYKIEKDRYVIDFVSLINFLSSSKKLANKLKEYGIGQYISKWRE